MRPPAFSRPAPGEPALLKPVARQQVVAQPQPLGMAALELVPHLAGEALAEPLELVVHLRPRALDHLRQARVHRLRALGEAGETVERGVVRVLERHLHRGRDRRSAVQRLLCFQHYVPRGTSRRANADDTLVRRRSASYR